MSRSSVAIGGWRRDMIASILKQVAKDGLDHPRVMDAAIDAIGCTFEGEAVQKIDDLGEIYWLNGEDDPVEAFGDAVAVTRGVFISDKED